MPDMTMPDMTIKDEVQSYEDSVDAELKRRLDLLYRSENPLESKIVQGRVRQLEEQRQHLEKSLRNTARNNNTEWVKALWKKLEASSRRLSLGLPLSRGDFLAELRWFSQQGKKTQELDLIRSIKINPSHYYDDEVRELLDIAENNILEKLAVNRYKYLVYCSSNNQNFGEGVVVLYRYPAFVIVEASEQRIAELRENYPIEPLSSNDYPLEGEEPSMRNQKVRFSVPILDEWKHQIEAIAPDVKILRPLGPYTLVVSVPNLAALEQIKNLREVKDVSPYVPDIQVRTEYLEQVRQEANEAAMNQARLNATDPQVSEQAPPIPGLLIADFFTSDDRDLAETNLAAQGIHVVSRPGNDRLIIDLSDHPDPQAALTVISEQPGLDFLEEKQLEIPFNDVARKIVAEGVLPANPHPGNTLGLTGAGEIIAVADTGLDTGEQSSLHQDLQGRVHSIHSLPIAPSYSERVKNPQSNDGAADDYSGHGTHIVGSLVGSGEKAAALGLSPIRGIALDAKIIFQAIEQTPQWTEEEKVRLLKTRGHIPERFFGGIPDDLEELFAHSYARGARIHSDSWGKKNCAEYDDRCKDLDRFVWNHKDFLVIVAAGNSGCQESSSPHIRQMSLCSPGVAKNCLTVGASENGRPNQFSTTYGQLFPWHFPRSPFHEATLVDSIDHIAAFSSRGPCKLSQRRKPDVLAPGTFILSTRSSRLPAANCADAPYPAAKHHYMYMHGTSMAASLVAGAAALVRQYLREHRSIPHPSAALVKAILIHSACYLPDGRNEINAGEVCQRNHPRSEPWADHEQGWGRVSLRNVLNPDPPTTVKFVDDAQGLTSGNERVIKIEILESAVPLRVTLAYTDYWGKNLINNLNLLVLSPAFDTKIQNRDHRYRGNDFLRQDQFDRLNNVEGVFIEQPMRGVWTIKVIATAISQGSQDFGSQDFSLVISGRYRIVEADVAIS